VVAEFPPDRQQSLGRCALVVDDDATIRDILRTLLTGAGFTVLLAASGREALSIAPNLDASVAILDLAMADGNGLQTCAALRKMSMWRDIPIFILTHHHTGKALNAALRAGATGFMCKPFVPSELIQQVLRRTGGSLATTPALTGDLDPAAAAGSAMGSGKPTQSANGHDLMPSLDHQRAVLKVYRSLGDEAIDDRDQSVVARDGRPRILLGENQHARETMRCALDAAGYVVDTASDGRDTLSRYVQNHYDLLLISIRMPVIGGFEIANSIRALQGAQGRTPIVALVEDASRLLANDLKDAGINGHLVKPVTVPGLLTCVRFHLPDTAFHKTGPLPAGTIQAPDIDTLHNMAKHFAPGAMVRFLGNLAVSIEEILPRLSGGWIVEQPAELGRRLHNLAGTAGTLGCGALSDAARNLQAVGSVSGLAERHFIATAQAALRAIHAYATAGSTAPAEAKGPRVPG
jgi:CheY-like chemotaxis protein